MLNKALCGLAAMVVFLAGCGSTPTARWTSTAEGFNAARKVVLNLHANDIVDDKTLIDLDKVEKVGRGALDVAYTQLPDGGDQFEDWLAVARGSLTELAKTYEGGGK